MKADLVNLTEKEELTSNLFLELERLYQDLEKELKVLNPGCNMCGTCCNFSVFDHVLYTSSIEVLYLTKHVEIPDFHISSNICPFLKDNQCSIRDFRTLGCRIFYCNPHYRKVTHDLYEKYHSSIKELNKKYNIQWEYQPFLNQLAKFKSKSQLLFNSSYPQ